jgi:hypothetical protein
MTGQTKKKLPDKSSGWMALKGVFDLYLNHTLRHANRPDSKSIIINCKQSQLNKGDSMWKEEVKTNLGLFIKAGLPYTLVGMIIVFTGLYLLKQIFAQNEYLSYILFAWLAAFWLVYQPLFKRKIATIKAKMKNS